jgi:hypothetical protein
MLTTRPPKPSCLKCNNVIMYANQLFDLPHKEKRMFMHVHKKSSDVMRVCVSFCDILRSFTIALVFATHTTKNWDTR